VQSQVENAIKHGISRLPGRGAVKVEARRDHDTLLIKVSNTGNINSQQPLTGVGFMNSIQRLQLLYGKQGQISIEEQDEMVVVDINIPTKKYESDHH
jgi:LytS/YehU family sensor histidine kinase